MHFAVRLLTIYHPVARVPQRWILAVVVAATLSTGTFAATRPLDVRDHRKDGRIRFLREIPRTIVPDHPAIVPVANAIRAVTSNPLEQLVLVNDVTHLLVDYDDDERVFGSNEFHATLDEMIARRRAAGWIYLRDDCDGRAVFAAHLLATLGIPWRLEASYWKAHAWVVARVDGVDFDLLEGRASTPETRRLMYRIIGHHYVRDVRPPPYFAWRDAWRERTGSNVEIGRQLGLLELGSTADQTRERHATDWTKVNPGAVASPFDPRVLTVASAGFPYGESLQPGNAWATVARTEDGSSPRAVLAGGSSIAAR